MVLWRKSRHRGGKMPGGTALEVSLSECCQCVCRATSSVWDNMTTWRCHFFCLKILPANVALLLQLLSVAIAKKQMEKFVCENWSHWPPGATVSCPMTLWTGGTDGQTCQPQITWRPPWATGAPDDIVQDWIDKTLLCKCYHFNVTLDSGSD